MHHPNDRNPTTRQASRCFRHHVWMAYCNDCRDAHAPLLRRNRETPAEESHPGGAGEWAA